MGEIAELAANGRLRTTTSARVPLTEASRAHRLLEEQTALGRVLLVP
jgi:NADPH:quinone reductase